MHSAQDGARRDHRPRMHLEKAHLLGVALMTVPDRMILMRIKSCRLTLGEVMQRVEGWAKALPSHEIYMDGDEFAIVAVRRSIA